MSEETYTSTGLLELLDELIEDDEQEIKDLEREVALDFILVMSANYAPRPVLVSRAELARERMEENAVEIKLRRNRIGSLTQFRDELERNPMYVEALTDLLGLRPK